MRLQHYTILPALRPYVKLICTMDCDEGADTNHIRILPDTCAELFINYTSTPVAVISSELHKRSIITFRMSKPMDVQMRKGAGCIAVCFHPGMAYNFFKIPMHVLADSTIALSAIWSGITAEIEDKLAGLCNNDARAEHLQKYLLQQLTPNKADPQLIHCLNQAQHTAGSIPVSRLTHDTGLSQRHLSRKFQQYVGLSPKEYLRACRFLRSLDHLKKYPGFSLTQIACESGYYDQSHFNRDYKAYTGHTPAEVLAAEHILY